jgi:two-component system sensor histidine kinase DctS
MLNLATDRRPVPAGDAPVGLPATCAALGALGDAVALIDRSSRSVCWASAAWLALLPALGAGTTAAQLDAALPGWQTALAAAADDAPLQHLALGTGCPWDAQLGSAGHEHWLLRVSDRRELGRALQRQLDDREQLLFTSRVISVGEMATTLAHELNQPIGATANLLRGLRSRLARKRSGLSAEESGALDRALEQVMFAARIITRIREFTHTHQPHHTRLDLAALLRASASLLDWDLRRSNATLSLELPSGAVPVRGDEVMLVIHTLWPMGGAGWPRDPPAEPRLCLRLLLRAGDAEVQVSDNGCGLSDDAEARLFVPFASTKPSGMGIGLSICRSFVELHQGRLWFSRHAGRGTTFHVGLPLLAAPSPSSANP